MTTGPDGDPVSRLDAHGYKTLEHDPDEVVHLRKAVRRIVDEGWSTAAVVRELNADGMPSPRGYRTSPEGTRERVMWTTTGLRRILSNPALRGFDVVGTGPDRFQIHAVQGRPHRPHPPILDDARWHALQRSLSSRRGRRRAAKEPLLAGLVWCHALRTNGNVCGRPMYGPGTVTTNSASYACRASNNLSKDDPERCSGNSVSAKNLHNLVELLVRGIASDERWPAAMESAYAAAHAPASNCAVDVLSEIARLEALMADLRKERETASSDRRRAMVDADINALDTEIAALEGTVLAPQGLVTTPVPLLSGWEGMSSPQRNNLLTALIERIEILPFQGAPGQRGRTFNPSRVRVELRSVGTFHITRSVDMRAVAAVSCPECGERYAEGSALGVHRRHRHGVPGANSPKPGGRTVYECPADDCARKSTSAGGMKRHVAAVHGPHAALPCPANGCSRVLKSATDLTSHIQMAHKKGADRTLAPCVTCGKVLRGEHGLRIHVGRIHPTLG